MPEESKDFRDSNSEKLSQYDWLIKPCEFYDEEYSDCTSIKARLNQLFIYGHSIDCSQWKRDSDNCYRWTDKQDEKAKKELILSEIKRRDERFKAHNDNDVWEKRTTPPHDWNKELPEELRKSYENTYLNIKSKELRGEIKPSFDTDSSCILL